MVEDVVVETNNSAEITINSEEEKLLDKVEVITVPQDAYCVIDIPRINLRAKVKKGVDMETLKNYAGIFDTSVMPGEYGNFAVCAHNNIYTELFRNLYKASKMDQIKVVTDEKEYIYEVISIEKIKPTRLDVLESNNTIKEITLITCTDMAKSRVCVKGKLISETDKK